MGTIQPRQKTASIGIYSAQVNEMPTPLKDQLKDKDREIAVLHELVRITSENPNADELLGRLCGLAAEQLKADSVIIYVFSEDRAELVLAGSHGSKPAVPGQVRLKL